MASARTLRGMRDLRSMRSVLGRSCPASAEGGYLDMHRLAAEKARLERELAMWQANCQRIEKRLGDIAIQLRQLRGAAACQHDEAEEAGLNGPILEEMTLTY